jgi:hypothetical protein
MTPLGGATVRIRGNGNADSLPIREPTGIPDSQQASGSEGVAVTGRGIIAWSRVPSVLTQNRGESPRL